MKVYIPPTNAGTIFAGEYAVNVTSNTVEVRSPHRKKVFVYTYIGGGRCAKVEGTTPVRIGTSSILTTGGEEK